MHRSRVGLAAAAFALLVGGCGGGSRSAVRAPGAPLTPLLSTPSPAGPAPTTPPTPSRAAAPAVSGPATAADLQPALLGLSDLETGHALVPPGVAPLVASSRLPACRNLVALLNAHAAPGSQGTARVGLDGGRDLVSVDERLDLFPTALDAGDRLISEVVAVRTCPTVTLRLAGLGTFPFTVQEVTFALQAYGYAARLTGTGDGDGLEFLAVGTSTGRTLVHLLTDADVGGGEDLLSQALDKVHGTGIAAGTATGTGAPA